MTPTTTAPAADWMTPELEADTRAVIEKLTTGRPVPPEVADRIREGAARIRDALVRAHGRLDIGVPAIRELRDGE